MYYSLCFKEQFVYYECTVSVMGNCNPVVEHLFIKGKVITSDVSCFSVKSLTPFRNAQVGLAMKLIHNHYTKTCADYTLMVY